MPFGSEPRHVGSRKTGMTGTAPAGGDIITNSRRVLLVVVCISVSDMIIAIILRCRKADAYGPRYGLGPLAGAVILLTEKT